jgi:hypothetical protein
MLHTLWLKENKAVPRYLRPFINFDIFFVSCDMGNDKVVMHAITKIKASSFTRCIGKFPDCYCCNCLGEKL